MTTTTPLQQVQLSFLDKTLALISWCLAGAAFLKFGWSVMAPDNPQGVVSLFARNGSLFMLLQSMILAAIMAAVVTAMAGRRLADVGTFAVSIGLALVSLQGAPARSLAVLDSSIPNTSHRMLALLFAAETAGWFLVVLVTLVVTGVVMRRLFAIPHEQNDVRSTLEAFASHTVAAGDLPIWRAEVDGTESHDHTPVWEGVRHMMIVIIGAFLFLALFGAVMNTRSAQHGQVLFMIWAAISSAVYLGHRLVPVRSAFWSILAVPLTAVATYVFASTNAPGIVPNIPTTPAMRLLPIQFVGAGTASAIAVFWSMYKPYATNIESDSKH